MSTFFLHDASRKRWHHTEVTVRCVITWLPPNHRKSGRHRMSFVIQPLRKICCTFTVAYVRGPGFILVADLASEIQIIRLFHYLRDGVSLPCKCHFTANVIKVICTINTFTTHQSCWINTAGIILRYLWRWSKRVCCAWWADAIWRNILKSFNVFNFQ